MTPAELKLYLAELRAAGLMAAHLKLPGGAEISCTFAPEIQRDPAVVEPERGGWKGPTHLDSEFNSALPD